MKKNDKLVVIIGVIVLVIASIGIYYWTEEIISEIATREDIFKTSGKLIDIPEAIKISDANAFYGLIATPLAVHYDSDGEKTIMPLYIENDTNPSTTVERVQKEQLDIYDVENLQDYENPKEMSLDIAKEYWESSKAVLLIKDDQEGYRLGVPATPIASYLSIPVIVTDEVCKDVREVLEDLGVEISIVCGDLEGFGKTFELEDLDEIIDLTVDLIREKFKKDVEYITITNPDDAFPPEVLDTTYENFEGTLQSANGIPSNIIGFITGRSGFSFTIPNHKSKYTRVTLEITTTEPAEDIEKFGDSLTVTGGLTGYISSIASTGDRDKNGHLTGERLIYDEVLYDMGGETYDVNLMGNFIKKRTEEYSAKITFEELDSPIDPLMDQLSSTAPYLTAHHMGIIYADPEMAFANDDDVKFQGENIPGPAQPRRHALLIPAINDHVYHNIHKPINNLIAKLKDINISNLQALKENCYSDPFYIALVGDTTMIPQYFYRNPHSDPYGSHQDVYGTNTPSDFIYGNVDPGDFSLGPFPEDFVENDVFTTGSNDVPYPVMENIVGRITGGFNVQETSALLARTIFYDDVLDSQPKEWREKALVMSGAGLEFQAIPGIDWIYKLLGSRDPMKCPSGQQHFLSFRTSNMMEKTGEFNVEVLERGQASRAGFSKEALNEIKKESGILNRLLFPKLNVQLIQGLENIQSLFSLDWWKTAFEDESGIHGEESQESANLIQVNSHGIFFDYNPADVQLYAAGGPPLIYQLLGRILFPITGLRSGLEGLAAFGVREVTSMEMGPSIMFIECCGGGKTDSLNPQTTLSAAYFHAGINAFICPSTLSAIGGYLEPRPFRLGWGLMGYREASKMARNGEYIPTEFCGWMFEEAYTALADDDIDIGLALRNARNDYLPDQIDVTYLWTPPLEDSKYQQPTYMKSTAEGASNVPVEKYAAVYQLNLLGDPMWNPYQPVNEG